MITEKIQLIKNAWKHFKKICIHKYWVAKYCFKLRLYWQGITHDLSKFSFTEFWESIHYYSGDCSPINVCKKEKGYSMAWFHHRGRNYHHYEMWIDNFDNGGIALEMPKKYAFEMLCDYIGAARAYMGDDFTWEKELEWWNEKKINAKMHSKTKSFLSGVFEKLMLAERHNTFDTKEISSDLFSSIVNSAWHDKNEWF